MRLDPGRPMGDLFTQILAVLGALGTIGGALLWRRQGRNLDADSRLKNAQAEVALSADARAWVERHADDAAEARRIAEQCQAELASMRAYLIEVEAWARRNARPDAEPMPRLAWRLPNPEVRPTDR